MVSTSNPAIKTQAHHGLHIAHTSYQETPQNIVAKKKKVSNTTLYTDTEFP
jgi:hypothetical protein